VTRSDGPAGAGERAVSDLVGFVLVFSLVVSVVTVVAVGGLDSLEATRDAEQTNNAERALEVLADNMDDLHERNAPSRATEISLQDDSVYLDDDVLIEVRDPDVAAHPSSFLTRTTFNVRPVVYDRGETELVYVMGAVFRVEREGGTVVRSWSPVLDRDRTVIPIVDVASATGGPQSLKSDTVLVRAQVNRRLVHVADGDASYDHVWINVTSPRHELWERMLTDHPRISCPSPDPDPNEVQCQLEYTPEQLYVTSTRISVEIEK